MVVRLQLYTIVKIGVTRHWPHCTTLSTGRIALHTPNSAHYTTHSKLCTLHYTLHTTHLALAALHYTLHWPHCTTHTAHSAHYTLHTKCYMLLTASLTLPVQPEYYRRTFIEKCSYFLEGAIFHTPIFYLDEKKVPKKYGVSSL